MKIITQCLRQSHLVPIFFIAIPILFTPGTASAITYFEYFAILLDQRKLSLQKKRTSSQEQSLIDQSYNLYKDMHGSLPALPLIGQISIDGQFPTALYDPESSITEMLSFQFIDPSSGLFATSFPAVSSVFYEVSDDPNTDIFLSLGTVTDSLSNFSIGYTVSGFEPIFRATPLDASGNPIVISGANLENVAIGLAINIAITEPVPVPAALWLFGSGLFGLVCVARRR